MLDQFFSQISFVDIFNFCVFLTFSMLLHVPAVLRVRGADAPASESASRSKNHRFAVVVSARNERRRHRGPHPLHQGAELSRRNSSTCSSMADNCTDGTADVAREAGAIGVSPLRT